MNSSSSSSSSLGAVSVEKRGTGGWEHLLSTDGQLTPGEEWRSTLHEIALQQFEQAADLLDLDIEQRTRLREPRRSLVVNFPGNPKAIGELFPVIAPTLGHVVATLQRERGSRTPGH